MAFALDPGLSLDDLTLRLHDVPLVAAVAGPHRDLARAMADHLGTIRPATGADALQALRSAFPNSPLSTRVAALSYMMRQ